MIATMLVVVTAIGNMIVTVIIIAQPAAGLRAGTRARRLDGAIATYPQVRRRRAVAVKQESRIIAETMTGT
jgi:hypothetical protein